MLRYIKIVLSLIVVSLFINSCDDYCDFEFSEEYFPLAVGNKWIYWDNIYGGIAEQWHINKMITNDGLNKYKLIRTYQDEIFDEGYFYFEGKKLFSTIGMPDNEEKNQEYILADFSLHHGEILETGLDGSKVIVGKKKNNNISFYISDTYHPAERYYPFEIITFEKGKGITEIWYGGGHVNFKLLDYHVM